MITRTQWLILLIFYILYLFFGAWIFRISEYNHEYNNLRRLHNKQRHLTDAISQVKDLKIRYEIRDSIREIERLTGDSVLLPNTFRNILSSHLEAFERDANFTMPPNITIPDFDSNNLSLSDAILNGNFSQFQSVWVLDETGKVNETLFEKFWKESKIDEDVAHQETMWTWYNSFFFSFQTITTIGFGMMAPKTILGKSLLILYSLFGVPFNGIVFASLADLFSKKFVKKIDNKRYELKIMIVLDAILYLIPGLFIFFITPSLIFMIVEGWDYVSSMYYVFVTLNTIGFGDMVSGYVNLSTTLLWLYRIFIHAWIIFGLGYLLMIITFIQKALRSKHLRLLDRRVSKLKKQKKKQSENVQSDLEKLRSILKAIYYYQEREPVRILGERETPIILGNENINEDRRTALPLCLYPGIVNRAYEYGGDEMNDLKMIFEDTFQKRKLSKEVDPMEIFMNIASTVIKESDEKKKLIKKMNREAHEKKMKLKQNNNVHRDKRMSHDGIVIEDITDMENGPKDDKEELQQGEYSLNPQKLRTSLRRKLSCWTMAVIPSHKEVKETDSMYSETTSSQEPNDEDDDDDDDDETKKDPSKINDLGDLIDKVGEIVNQEITGRSEILKFNRTQSDSALCDMVNRDAPSFIP
ncbi:UNVERIFIED_CONTAM: hypothetical protein RMT77_005187 [Armadillidium vulgare]